MIQGPAKTETYYLDESGSSGDLADAGPSLGFGCQPVFVLACLGVDDPVALQEELSRLSRLHRLRSGELKSKHIRTKPRFIADLATYLSIRRLPLFVEVVEKRFQLCAMMVDNLVMPPVGPMDLEPGALWVKKMMAEYMRQYMPEAVMSAYIHACNARTQEATEAVYKALLDWVEPLAQSNEFAWGIHDAAADTLGDFRELDASDPERWRRGLPIPDDSKNGKPFWMLPNLSSFTNIYARLNHRHGRRVKDLVLIHDEQLQFDQILHKSKVAAESMARQKAVPSLRFANYDFAEQAQLTFARSDESAGIQAADLLAGFTMRYAQDVLFAENTVHPSATEAFQSLLELSVPRLAIGFNFMTSTPHAGKIQLFGVSPR